MTEEERQQALHITDEAGSIPEDVFDKISKFRDISDFVSVTGGRKHPASDWWWFDQRMREWWSR